MAIEFTAVYETHPNGVVKAYVAENTKISTGARTLEEARSQLAERLRSFLEGERYHGLAVASPKALIESIRVDLRSPEEVNAEHKRMQAMT